MDLIWFCAISAILPFMAKNDKKVVNESQWGLHRSHMRTNTDEHRSYWKKWGSEHQSSPGKPKRKPSLRENHLPILAGFVSLSREYKYLLFPSVNQKVEGIVSTSMWQTVKCKQVSLYFLCYHHPNWFVTILYILMNPTILHKPHLRTFEMHTVII